LPAVAVKIYDKRAEETSNFFLNMIPYLTITYIEYTPFHSCYINAIAIPAVIALMIRNDAVVEQASWYPDVGIEISPFGAVVIGGATAAGADDTVMLVGVVAIGDIIVDVGVALLGLAIVGAAIGAKDVMFVALLVTGVKVGTMGALVVVVISMHVIMEVMVVQIRVNQIAAAVVAASISTIDIDAFVEVQQLKSGSWAVTDELKTFLVLLV
jgi:hypothetical protein